MIDARSKSVILARSRHALATAVIFSAPALTAADASAAEPTAARALSYAVQFRCGPLAADTDAARGVYLTSIQVHNPHHFNVQFRKKAVLSFPDRSASRGQFASFLDDALGPDEAFTIDCGDVRTLLGGAEEPAHIAGFVVLEVPDSSIQEASFPGVETPFLPALDVMGQYTARERNSGVSELEIERISGTPVFVSPFAASAAQRGGRTADEGWIASATAQP